MTTPTSPSNDRPPAETTHPARSRARLIRWVAALAFLALAVHLMLPAIAGYDETQRTIRTLAWWLVVAALVAEVGSYVGSGLLIQGLVRVGGGKVSVMRGVGVTVAAAAVGIVGTGIVGSTVAMYEWLHHGDTDGKGAGSAAGLKPVFNNAVLCIVGTYGILHLLILGDLTSAELVGFGVLLVILLMAVGVIVWGAMHPESLRRRLVAFNIRWNRLRKKRQPDDGRVDRSIDQVRNAWIFVRSGGWERPLLGAVINTGLDALCLYLLFRAAGDHIGVGALLAGYSLPLLLGKVAFIPGGIGVVEASMVTMFTTLGVENGTAVVAVLAYRLMSFWIPAIIGLPLAAILQRHSSRRPRLAS